jgi:DNA-binding MarR family transcriptional regulator
MPESPQKRLADALRAVYKRLDLARDELLQLSPKELALLLILEEQGQCRVNQLAEAVKLPLSTVSWTADRMVTKGYLSRKPDPDDRRAILLEPAELGKQALEMHHAVFDHLAGVVVTNLADEEAEQMITIIEKTANFFD